jgi:hypothetical protein
MLADACPGEALPPAMQKKLDKAAALADDPGDASPKKRAAQLRRACRLLLHTATAARKASAKRHHRMSSACAASLGTAIGNARQTLGCGQVAR